MRDAPILPIRGGAAHVPAPGVLRARLAGHAAEPGTVRGAVAAAWWVMERARQAEAGSRFWWEAVVEPDWSSVSAEMGISGVEARAGLALGRDAGVLLERPGGVVLDPDALVEHAALAALRWDTVRAAAAGRGARLGPVLAVLREVARRTGGGDPAQEARLSLEGLCEETLYGKSAVAGAVSDLLASGLLRRPQGAERQYRFLLGAAALGDDAPRREASAFPTAPAPAPASNTIALPEGAEVTLLGAPLRLAPGARISVGEAVAHIHVDRDAHGREIVQIGSLSIRLP